MAADDDPAPPESGLPLAALHLLLDLLVADDARVDPAVDPGIMRDAPGESGVALGLRRDDDDERAGGRQDRDERAVSADRRTGDVSLVIDLPGRRARGAMEGEGRRR